MEWSSYQQAIFADLASGEGHTVVLARAGSGKTTTIVEGLNHLPADTHALLVAFNKSIQMELSSRCPPGCEVRTLHSLGLVTLKKAFGNAIVIDARKVDSIADLVLPRVVGDDTRSGFCKLVSLAKNHLVDEKDELLQLCYSFGIEPDEEDEITMEKFVGLVKDGLELCAEWNGTIDFDDMVWLPVVHKLKPPQFDVVLVDETQDLNLTQIRLAQAACRKGGRIIAVGDDKQAIYLFRGADHRAVSRIVDELEAKILPLSVTYRCPRRVVELVRNIVPDLECPPSAPDGEVRTVPTIDGVGPGDFVLSRTNAPLATRCLRLLRAGVKAVILGRDIGAGLISLIKKSHKKTIPDLAEWLGEWERREIAKLTRAKRDDRILAVQDKVETILAVSEGCSSIEELIRTLEQFFKGNGEEGKIPRDAVIFSTVHKAKGLESDRVWILVDTFAKIRRWRPESVEEDNIWYVALTRCRGQLNLVEQRSE